MPFRRSRGLVCIGFLIAIVFSAKSAKADTWGLPVDTMTISAQRLGSYVMTGNIFASTTTLVTELGYAEAAGIGTVRINGDSWDYTEPSSGTFDWSLYDRVIRIVTGTATNEFGMELLVTIPLAPSWQCSRFTSTSTLNPYTGAVGGATHYPTNDMGLLRRWCTNFATRYAGSIKYFEVGNEPDFKNFFIDGSSFPASTGFLTNTTNYLLILSTASDAIRAADPDCEIMNGGIAFPKGITQGVYGGDTSLYTGNHWFADLLSRGATQYIDIVNVHHYLDGELGNLTTDIVLSTITAMWQNRMGAGSKPRIWITEIGTTGGSYQSGDIPLEHFRQANWIYQSYAQHLSSGTERVFWHVVKAPGPDGISDYAMMTSTFGVKLAYTAHDKFHEWLNGYTFAGTDNSGNRVGTKWINGNSTRYVYGTNTGTGSVSFLRADSGTKIDPYSTETSILGKALESYSINTSFFILDVRYPKFGLFGTELKNLIVQ